MTAAERYLELGLRLGRHVDGLVDSYYGPAELKEQVDAAELVAPAQLVEDAASLHESLDDGYLRDQVHGCWTCARVLAGEELSYSDEVEGSYGVRPRRTPESVFERAHAELDGLLPGDGPLDERRRAWRERHICPGDKAVEVLGELLPLLRARTLEVVDLPVGESPVLEPVRDEPWWAFNYYLGDLQSRVAVNVDIPTTAVDVIHLAAHEVYPGHHTEHAVKEQLLLRERGALEEAIQLVPTPQAVLSEGIAELGLEVVLDADGRAAAYDILARHGIELDRERVEAIAKALEPLETVGLDAALNVYEDGASAEDAQRYIEEWRLATPEQAKHSVRFFMDPTWRDYGITYSAGKALCRAYVGDDPARFRRLLTEHVRIGELHGAL